MNESSSIAEVVEPRRGSWIANSRSWSTAYSHLYAVALGYYLAGSQPPTSLNVATAVLVFVGFGLAVMETPPPKRYRLVACAFLAGGLLIASVSVVPPGLSIVLAATGALVLVIFAYYERGVERALKATSRDDPGRGA